LHQIKVKGRLLDTDSPSWKVNGRQGQWPTRRKLGERTLQGQEVQKIKATSGDATEQKTRVEFLNSQQDSHPFLIIYSLLFGEYSFT